MQAAPCPHGPELRFLQDYDDVTIAAGPEVTSLPHEVRVTMVSDPLTDGWYFGHPKYRRYHADYLSELLNVLRDRTGLAGHSRPYCSLRPL